MATVSVKGLIEEVTREFLRGSRPNAWEIMAEDALRKDWEVFGFERLNKHQEEASRLVVESKSDVFVNLPNGFRKSVVFQVLSVQGHPTTVFWKIKYLSRRSKYCLELSITWATWGPLKISRLTAPLMYNFRTNKFPTIFWSLICNISLPRLAYFS